VGLFCLQQHAGANKMAVPVLNLYLPPLATAMAWQDTASVRAITNHLNKKTGCQWQPVFNYGCLVLSFQ